MRRRWSGAWCYEGRSAAAFGGDVIAGREIEGVGRVRVGLEDYAGLRTPTNEKDAGAELSRGPFA